MKKKAAWQLECNGQTMDDIRCLTVHAKWFSTTTNGQRQALLTVTHNHAFFAVNLLLRAAKQHIELWSPVSIEAVLVVKLYQPYRFSHR